MTKHKSTPAFTFEDANPPARTREASSVYHDVAAAFAESGKNSVRVTIEGKTPSKVYHGLRTALRAKPIKGVNVVKRGSEADMTVYLTFTPEAEQVETPTED